MLRRPVSLQCLEWFEVIGTEDGRDEIVLDYPAHDAEDFGTVWK